MYGPARIGGNPERFDDPIRIAYSLAGVENLQRLRVLRAIATEGSFTAAATALSMSQPSVSQHVTVLERELGVRLVDRTTLGARLTAEGQVVLRHALRILKIADDARRELNELRSGVRSPIRVAAFPTACTFLLPQAITALQRLHPNVSLTLAETDGDDALAQVRQGTADLGIAYDYAAHPIDLRGLAAQPLMEDPLRLALPVHHPAAGRPVVDLADLRDEPWIIGTAFGCAESLRTACGAAGFTPRRVLDSNRYPTTLALVAAGHGLALVPQTALGNPPPGTVARPLRPDPTPRRIWAATGPHPTEATAAFIDCLLGPAGGEEPAAVLRQRPVPA